MMERKLSFIVPCYNEEGNIPLFFERMKDVFRNETIKYELIFVNDGSKDATLHVLKETAKKNPNLNTTILSFTRNFGKEAAILAGLKNAEGDYICIIDADLQQDPKYAKDMLAVLEKNEEYDCVAAYQKTRKEGAVLTAFKKLFYKIINRISDIEFVDGASDFRLFRRCVAEAMMELQEYHRFTKGIFSWVGFNTYYYPYEVKERENGNTSWSFWKLFRYAIEGIVSFTTTPLIVSAWLGFIVSFAAFLYLIVVVVQKLCFGIDIAGYPTIIVLILLLGGIQLIVLGVLGQYLAKTYLEVKRRPIYIVKEQIKSRNTFDEQERSDE